MTDDQQQEPIDGRYVVPSNHLQIPSIVNQSPNQYLYTSTPDPETSDDTLIDNSSQPIENRKQKSISPDVYILSDHDSPQNLIDLRNSPSPLVHLSPNKKKIFFPTTTNKKSNNINRKR